jgi:rubrerythrin
MTRTLILLCLGLSCAMAAASPTHYPQTIEALQERYADEVRAHQEYGAYARHALQEGHPNIAHLFRTLATSEAVHARNFAELLKELGATPQAPRVDPRITSTRDHLQRATEVEADEIDTQYPTILEQVRPEGYEAAIEKITWAWEAEKQHRDLIIKIRDAASIFFGLLVNRIEGEPSHYHVCQVCGSTLDQPPAKGCPICGHPASEYREIPWVAAPAIDDAAPADGFD